MKIAILGVSAIAANTTVAMKKAGMHPIAIMSRDRNKGEAFKVQHGLNKVYTNYDELLSDPEIDTVYVGLPNSLHHSYAKKALLAGKNVLLEKPFTMDLKEAVDLRNTAVAHHRYLFETITTLYQPLLPEIVADLKQIGPVHLATINFTKYSSRYDDLLAGKKTNTFDVGMGGGAFYDLNIYNLHLAYELFGRPTKISYEANYQNACDISGIAILKYPNTVVACIAGKDAHSEMGATFMGEKGYIKINGAPSLIKDYECVIKGKEPKHMSDDTDAYQNEFSVIETIYKRDAYKTHLHLLDRSLEVMKLVDLVKAR